MKKQVISAAMALLITIGSTACGGTATIAPTDADRQTATKAESAAPSQATESGERVNLRISWWGGDSRHEKTLKALELFMEKHPNITVDADYGSWNGWTEKISTQLAGNAAPDVMQTNWNWLYQFSADGSKYADLNEFKDVFEDFKDYDPDTLATCFIAGKQQALPISTTGKVFYWNKSTFDKAGIDIPVSFQELIDAGHVFRDKLGDDYYPLALFEYERMLLMVYYLESKYEKLWAVDNKLNYTVEELTDGLQWIQSLEENHVLPSISHLVGQGADAIEKNPDWMSGKYAGFFEWDSAQKKFAEALEPGQEFVLGEYISGFDKKLAGIYKISQTWAISERCEHKREAAELISFLVSDPEVVKLLGTERGIVTNASARQILTDSGMMTGLTAEGNALAMANANYPLDPNFENSALKDPTGHYFEVMAALSDGEDPASLAQELYDNISSVYSDSSF